MGPRDPRSRTIKGNHPCSSCLTLRFEYACAGRPCMEAGGTPGGGETPRPVDRPRKNGAPDPFRGNAMLRKHSHLLSGLFISDMSRLVRVVASRLLDRFNWDLIPIERGVPRSNRIFDSSLRRRCLGPRVQGVGTLQLPRRGASLIYEFRDLLKASTSSTMILILITFFVRDYSYSRVVMVYLLVPERSSPLVSRSALRELLRLLRRRGYNLRHALIVE